MDNFGSEELDPIAFSKKEPNVLDELQDHIAWEITDNLNDSPDRSKLSIATHNMLVIGVKLLMDRTVVLFA